MVKLYLINWSRAASLTWMSQVFVGFKSKIDFVFYCVTWRSLLFTVNFYLPSQEWFFLRCKIKNLTAPNPSRGNFLLLHKVCQCQNYPSLEVSCSSLLDQCVISKCQNSLSTDGMKELCATLGSWVANFVTERSCVWIPPVILDWYLMRLQIFKEKMNFVLPYHMTHIVQ